VTFLAEQRAKAV